MTKIQYMGLSDSRTIAAGDTINGAVVGGIAVSITWNRANNWMIDTTQAPYTAITAPMATAILAIPHAEFVDVTSTPQTPTGRTYYPNVGTTTQATPSHTVSSGATPTITSGAGAVSAAVGGNGANDRAGTFTATALASGNVADEVLCTVTFAQPYSSPPKDINIDPTNPASAAAQLYAMNFTATSFQIAAHVAPTASAVIAGTYEVVG